jgi:ferredoxin-nitrite reductase
VFVRPEEAAEICSAIVLVFRDHGSREARNKIRLAFLVEAWGEVRVREAPPSAPATGGSGTRSR